MEILNTKVSKAGKGFTKITRTWQKPESPVRERRYQSSLIMSPVSVKSEKMKLAFSKRSKNSTQMSSATKDSAQQQIGSSQVSPPRKQSQYELDKDADIIALKVNLMKSQRETKAAKSERSTLMDLLRSEQETAMGLQEEVAGLKDIINQQNETIKKLSIKATDLKSTLRDNEKKQFEQMQEKEEQWTGTDEESATVLTLKLMQMTARVEELEQKLTDKTPLSPGRKKKLARGASLVTEQLCTELPCHLEKEELVVLTKQGSVFDEAVVKEAVMLGFATSRTVREDAVLKIRRSLEGYTARRVNIATYEQARLDNSVLWERPAESIDMQVRGLVFIIWSSRPLNDDETLDAEQVNADDGFYGEQNYFE